MGLLSKVFKGAKSVFDSAKDLASGSLFDGLGTSILSGGLSFLGGERANRASERMSNTSYQRAVKDMEAAGLNPMLAYSQGGASTPNMMDTATPAVSSAQHGRRLSEDVKNLRATNELIREQTRSQVMNQEVASSQYTKNMADAYLSDAQKATTKADAALKVSSARNMDVMSRLYSAQLPAAEAQADYDRSQIGQLTNKYKRIRETVGASPVNSGKRLSKTPPRGLNFVP